MENPPMESSTQETKSNIASSTSCTNQDGLKTTRKGSNVGKQPNLAPYANMSSLGIKANHT